MLASVRSLISAENGASEQQQLDINVFLVRATVLEVLTPQGDDYFIKVSRAGNLRAEYQAMLAANHAFPLITAHPIGLHSEEGRDFLLSERVEHIAASRTAVEAVEESAWRSFAALLLDGCPQGDAEPAPNHEVAIKAALVTLEDSFLRDSILAWIDARGRPILQRLAHIRQHGDLAINNVGMTTNGLVVFDWEDYGCIDFPLFDFAVFLCSAYRFNSKDILGLILNEPGSRLAALSEAIRERYNLGKFELVRLLALALVLFRRLKADGGYSDEIIGMVSATIDDIWQFVDVLDQDAMRSSSA